MSSSFVRIPDDSGYSGPRIRTFTTTDGGNTVHQHAMVLVDQNGNPITPTNPSDTQPITGTVSVDNFPATQPVSGPITDTQLRASPVPTTLSGLTTKALNNQIVATDVGLVSQTVIHGLTTGGGGGYVEVKVTPSGAVVADTSGSTQPISGSVSVSNFPATQPISGSVSISNFPGTQPVSASSLPLPSGASTEATLALIKAKTDNLDVALSTRTKPADTQNITGSVSVSNFPATQVVTGIFFQATQPVSIASPIVSKTTDEQTLTGVYYYHAGALTVQAAADAATAGRFWVINPIGSGGTIRIKSIEFASQLGSALAAPTSPRITIERVSFTGTSSGATLTAAKRKTSDATPKSILTTASTGLTLTAGSVIMSLLPIASATAVGYTASAVEKWKPDINDRIELVPGEGIVCRQADTGTTSDTRRFTIDITLEEF